MEPIRVEDLEIAARAAVRESAAVAARWLRCAELVRRWPYLAGHWPGRPYDFAIGGEDDPYLLRWWLMPRSELHPNVYLHWFLRGDDDRALHDHPWVNTTFVRAGRYQEVVPAGGGAEQVLLRTTGDIVPRSANARHRIALLAGDGPAVTLFATGAKEREWGFWCGDRFVHWADFTAPGDSSRTGRGCGEPGNPTPASRPGTREHLTPA